jgi:hypothetical protein
VSPLRRQWLCTRINDLGPRVLYELIDELDRHHRLEAYANMDPELLWAVGADRIVPLPIFVIGGRQK